MTTQDLTTTPVRRRRVLTVAGATAAAVLPWIAAEASGTTMEVTSAGTTIPISLPLVVATALVVSLAGWWARVLLDRRAGDPPRAWTALAVTVLVVSLPPLLVVETSAELRLYLALMHVAVGAVLIPGLRSPA